MDVENLNANASLEQANQTIKRLGREVKRLIALIDKVNVEIKEARREKAAYLQEDVALDVARKEQQIESITQRCSTYKSLITSLTAGIQQVKTNSRIDSAHDTFTEHLIMLNASMDEARRMLDNCEVL